MDGPGEAGVETPCGPWRKAAEVGITGCAQRQEGGGGGFPGAFSQRLVQEEPSVDDLGIGDLLRSNGLLAGRVLECGAKERKQRWLTPLTDPDTLARTLTEALDRPGAALITVPEETP
ncbi:acyl-CoA dehydrogenase family protein [Streptomyces sp. NPDC006314]|uniref:acyl-CoA dehydrogenase family protein n=1 Tax=Streptomyces sp. NPDC006314 TaxID=3154475 RepID=UPI0033AF8684